MNCTFAARQTKTRKDHRNNDVRAKNSKGLVKFKKNVMNPDQQKSRRTIIRCCGKNKCSEYYNRSKTNKTLLRYTKSESGKDEGSKKTTQEPKTEQNTKSPSSLDNEDTANDNSNSERSAGEAGASVTPARGASKSKEVENSDLSTSASGGASGDAASRGEEAGVIEGVGTTREEKSVGDVDGIVAGDKTVIGGSDVTAGKDGTTAVVGRFDTAGGEDRVTAQERNETTRGWDVGNVTVGGGSGVSKDGSSTGFGGDENFVIT
jgi:hypothetical protein